jgi:hypothetical protein
VYRTEMPAHFSEFVAEDDVVHFHFEATLISSCGCDILCVLSSCANYMELLVFLTVK